MNYIFSNKTLLMIISLEKIENVSRSTTIKSIFNKLLNQKPGKGGEIHITDAIQSLINDNEKFIGHIFKGKYLDCGTMEGYIKSSVEISKI